LSSISNPQHGPALALAQLLTEFPELPTLRWGIGPDGHLSGAAFELDDLQAAVTAFTTVLGGKASPSMHEKDGVSWMSVSFWPVWRDVQFYITLGGHAVEASVSLPVEWSAAKQVAA
jgi:hypothetical protein